MEIVIKVIGREGYVWSKGDVNLLKETYRIIGTFTGCLPGAPRQNVQLGLPLQLMPEEITLLLEKGIAKCFRCSTSLEPPNDADIKAYKENRDKCYLEQVEICKNKRKEEILLHKDQIIAGMKKRKQRKLEKLKNSGKDMSQTSSVDEEFDIDKVKIDPIPEDSAYVQLFTANPFPKQEEEFNWSYPETEIEKIRYATFRDLWEQGYYITTGNKFGGDYLIYPGDPGMYHAFYVAICLPYKEKFTGYDLVAWGRLSVNVKKHILLCSLDPEKKIVYNTIQWTGMK